MKTRNKTTIVNCKGFKVLLEITENLGFSKSGNFEVLNSNLTGLDYETVRKAISRIHGRRAIISTEISLINTAVFDGCKNVKIIDGKPDFSEYSNLKVKGTKKTDWIDYLLSGKINMEQHFSFGTLSRRHNVRKGLLNAKQLVFWQGYFTAKFGHDFGINNY